MISLISLEIVVENIDKKILDMEIYMINQLYKLLG